MLDSGITLMESQADEKSDGTYRLMDNLDDQIVAVVGDLSVKKVPPGMHSIGKGDQIVGIYIDVQKGEMWSYSREDSQGPERDGFFACQDEKETSFRRCVCCYVYFPK